MMACAREDIGERFVSVRELGRERKRAQVGYPDQAVPELFDVRTEPVDQTRAVRTR